MKVAAGSPLIAYMLSEAGLQFLMTELFEIELRDGTTEYYTNLDMDITYGGHTYLANSIRIEGMRYRVAVGLQVEEQDVKISAYPGESLVNATFFSSIGAGLLDGAYITRKRAFWQPATGVPAVDFLQAPLDVVTLFVGLVSSITKLGRTFMELKVKSPLKLLDIDMPRNTYQPGCQWLLYDSGCTLNRATFTDSYTVTAATETQITVASISPVNGADGIPYYQQGRLLFTSGNNSGIQTIVSFHTSTVFWLQYPLVEPPAVGDTFDVSAGCSKIGRGGACELKFNNLTNFRGFPRVPPIVLSA